MLHFYNNNNCSVLHKNPSVIYTLTLNLAGKTKVTSAYIFFFECSAGPAGSVFSKCKRVQTKPSRSKPGGLGDSRKHLADWRRINGGTDCKVIRLSARLRTTSLNLWRFPITALRCGSVNRDPFHKWARDPKLFSPHNDGATHAEIFRAQFSSPIRLWRDS